MKRNEFGVVLTSCLVAGAIIAMLVIWSHLFASSDWSNGGSNLLGLIVGPSLVATIGVAAWTRWSIRCRATKPCVRRGEHPVAGTTKKVCEHHHTLQDHKNVYAAFKDDDKLAWGESHNLEEQPPDPAP